MSSSLTTGVPPTLEGLTAATQFSYAYQNTPNGRVVSEYKESQAITPPNTAAFTSLGIIQLNGVVERGRFQISARGAGSLPGGGLQVQINYKISPNSPWITAWSWTSLMALSPGQGAGTPSLIVYAPGQSAMILPNPSDTVFELDCRGLHAIDFQVSPTTGASGVNTSQLFADLIRGN